MAAPKALKAKALRRNVPRSLLRFETTDQLADLESVLGQSRAVEALELGIGIGRPGFNLFAFGPAEANKRAVVEGSIQKHAAGQATPGDWVYVHNFARPHNPDAVPLPPGRGGALRDDMERFIEELRTTIPAAFETDEYRARALVFEDEVKERHQQELSALERRAQARGTTLVRTPLGMGFAPVRDGKVIEPEAFAELPEAERERIAKEIASMQTELQALVAQFPIWQREGRDKLKALNREVTAHAVGLLIDELREKHADLSGIVEYLNRVESDVVDNAELFRRPDDGPSSATMAQGLAAAASESALGRYRVNLLVDHGATDGAPFVYEPNPSYQNLVGRVEHRSEMGTLTTDFSLIKAGALHKANGGYLILDAHKVLIQPYAWEGLKQALTSKDIRIESLGQMFSIVSTVSLEPAPIPLDVKVVLLGEPMLYYLIHARDPDFSALFKVAVDFDDRMPRDRGTSLLYARFIATQARAAGLRPLDRDAVGAVIAESARLAGDAERLSARTRLIDDLLSEADYRAAGRGASVIGAEDVAAAIAAATRRSDRLRRRLQDETERGTILIDTAGNAVGQVNGLSVIQLGGYGFGRPSRITARIRIGRGEVVDIEREVELGGPLHSKGVLILSSYLAARYAVDEPLSLSASLVFEQSYGGVDGDSASSAELYALLSALAEVPIRQSLAVTGSINQNGAVQAIGGVNEKIEGFFDLCRARGLTGDQGVLVPASNVKHLMLRADVVEAASAGRFHVYPIETIDQGIEVLTGHRAGRRGARDRFPKGTINRLVADRLRDFAEKRRQFGGAGRETETR